MIESFNESQHSFDFDSLEQPKIIPHQQSEAELAEEDAIELEADEVDHLVDHGFNYLEARYQAGLIQELPEASKATIKFLFGENVKTNYVPTPQPKAHKGTKSIDRRKLSPAEKRIADKIPYYGKPRP